MSTSSHDDDVPDIREARLIRKLRKLEELNAALARQPVEYDEFGIPMHDWGMVVERAAARKKLMEEECIDAKRAAEICGVDVRRFRRLEKTQPDLARASFKVFGKITLYERWLVERWAERRRGRPT